MQRNALKESFLLPVPFVYPGPFRTKSLNERLDSKLKLEAAMFKDSYVSSTLDLNSKVDLQEKQNPRMSEEGSISSGVYNAIDIPDSAKLRIKCKKQFMNTMLQDLAKLEQLLSSRDSPPRSASRDGKDGDKKSYASLLRLWKHVDISAKWETDQSCSDVSSHSDNSVEGSSAQKSESDNNNVNHNQGEMDQSISFGSKNALSRDEKAHWDAMKTSTSNIVSKIIKSSETYRDDTYLIEGKKMIETSITPKCSTGSHFDTEGKTSYLRASFDRSRCATFSDKKAFCDNKKPKLSRFGGGKDQKEHKMISTPPQKKTLEQSLHKSIMVAKKSQLLNKQSSLLERRKAKNLTIETKPELGPSLESLRVQSQFHRVLRPATWQLNSLNTLVSALERLKGEPSFKIVLSPVSSAHVVSQAKQFGSIKCISTWPYIHFNSSKDSLNITKFKESQPIRSKADQLLLLENLLCGNISAIASGHKFVAKEFKKIDNGCFFKAVGGIVRFIRPLLCWMYPECALDSAYSPRN